jgi:hypothetical protein
MNDTVETIFKKLKLVFSMKDNIYEFILIATIALLILLLINIVL